MGHLLKECGVPGLLNLVIFLWIWDILRAIFFGLAVFKEPNTEICEKSYNRFCLMVFIAATAHAFFKLPIILCGDGGDAPDIKVFICCFPAACCSILVYLFDLVVLIWATSNKFTTQAAPCYTTYPSKDKFISIWLLLSYTLICLIPATALAALYH